MQSRPPHPSPRTAEPVPGLTLSRRASVAVGIAAATILAWAGAATWYIGSRDELAQRVFVRETETRYAYEDRIAHLAARLEREVTGNLVERRTFDARVAALAAKQAEIQARQTWLRRAAEQAGLSAHPLTTGSLPDRKSPVRPNAAGLDSKPAPLSETGLRLRDEPASEAPRDRMSALERALDGTAVDEMDLVRTIGRTARTRLTSLRAALDATGLDVASATPTKPGRGTGGPLVPADGKGGALGFLLADLGACLSEIERLDAAARTLPLGLPLAGELDPTSSFGQRLDPFTRGLAMHTGVDFRAETGTPARAAGSGRVVLAEYSGGYGNLVEIDHGGGIVTRYGHLAGFAVAPGERVEAGRVVGYTGSTGRSTGPHLHYEVRIAGEPVSPLRFLDAGRLLPNPNG